MIAIYNNILTQEKDLNISPTSPGFTYGEGFFTTIKVEALKPENLDLHIKRIESSLLYFSFKIKLPNIADLINTLLVSNKLTNARVKIVFFQDLQTVSVLFLCQNLIIDNNFIELTTSEYIRGNDPIYKYKTLNYYSNLKSWDKIFLDHKNRILETGFANIFIIKDDRIITPPATLPILPGTYRNYLLNLGSVHKYKIIEEEIYTQDLFTSEGVFITNSIKGIVPVSKIDNKNILTNEISNIIRYL